MISAASIAPSEVHMLVEDTLGLLLSLAHEKSLPFGGYTAVYRVAGEPDFVWAYTIGGAVAMHRCSELVAQAAYNMSTGATGEVWRIQAILEQSGEKIGPLFPMRPVTPPPPPDAAMTLHEALVRARNQGRQLRAKLKKARAERDRYRDLYNEATKALQAATARHPNF